MELEIPLCDIMLCAENSGDVIRFRRHPKSHSGHLENTKGFFSDRKSEIRSSPRLKEIKHKIVAGTDVCRTLDFKRSSSKLQDPTKKTEKISSDSIRSLRSRKLDVKYDIDVKKEDESFSEASENEDESYKGSEDESSSDVMESEDSFSSTKENRIENFASEDNNLSEYEKMVQRNREEKIAFLKSLKIDEIKEGFIRAAKPKTTCPRVYKRPRPHELLPVRKSRRLAKMDINLSEDALYERALAEAAEEQKRKELPAQYAFKEALQEEEDYSGFINDFDFSVTEKKAIFNDYVSRFKHMKIHESNIAKVVPTRITALAVHPTTDNVIVIAGSKYGNIGFWNVTSNSDPLVFTPHLEGITNLKINPHNPLQVVSSSYDGTVRCGDLENKVFNEVYNVSEETCCTNFDFFSSKTFLVALKSGYVSIVDARNKRLQNEKKHLCSNYSVKSVSVHPVNKSLFLTADSKGAMKLWDLRKLQSKPVITIQQHKRSISSAFFSPVTGNSILSTSADDSLCIFDSSNVEKEILYKKYIRHNNQTGRWLTPFKATWLPNSDDVFVVGSMLYPRRVEIFDRAGNNILNFTDEEHLTSITSVNQFHPSLSILAGANSSGKVFVFMDTQLKF